LLNDETVYTDLEQEELKIGLIVDIEGIVRDNRTYATEITLVASPEPEEPEEPKPQTGIKNEGEVIIE
jgi:hypothetical protein